jgi:RNA polymerase sigma-70 factor (ECF subfamily)
MGTVTSATTFDSDEALLLRFRDTHDDDAFSELLARYERPLFNYLARYTGDLSQAEELFMATFERVFERCAQFEPGRRVKPWIYSIATHLAIDAMRRSGRHRAAQFDTSIEDDESDVGTLFDLVSDRRPGPIASLEAGERRNWVRRAVQDLPDDLRAVILLAYYESMTLREVAQALDLPIGTVKSRLHRGLLQLNQAWKAGHSSEAA